MCSGQGVVTLPTAKAVSFSVLGRATCRMSAGTTGRPLLRQRMASILGGIQDDCECFTPGQLAPGNAANIRLCKEHWAEAHQTRVHRPCEQTEHSTARTSMHAVGLVSPDGGPAFTPMAKARSRQPGSLVDDG